MSGNEGDGKWHVLAPATVTGVDTKTGAVVSVPLTPWKDLALAYVTQRDAVRDETPTDLQCVDLNSFRLWRGRR